MAGVLERERKPICLKQWVEGEYRGRKAMEKKAVKILKLLKSLNQAHDTLFL